jgi:hypothetical protein
MCHDRPRACHERPVTWIRRRCANCRIGVFITGAFILRSFEARLLQISAPSLRAPAGTLAGNDSASKTTAMAMTARMVCAGRKYPTSTLM